MCDTCEWEAAIKEADDILELLEEIPVSHFSESVQEKSEGIRATISEHEHATAKQKSALENMRKGVDKWLR